MVGSTLRGVVPRRVELHLGLGVMESVGFIPREVEISLARGRDTLWTTDQRFVGDPPADLVFAMNLPEGALRARVAVRVGTRVVTRNETVVVRADHVLEIPTPVVSPEFPTP